MNNFFKKLLNLRKTDPGLFYVSGGNLIFALVGGLFWLVIAMMMPTGEYGELNYYLAIASLGSTISILGLNTTIITFTAKGLKQIKYEAVSFILITNLIASLIAWIIFDYFPLVILFIGSSFFTMSIAVVLGKQLFKKYFFLLIAERITQIILSLSFFYFIGIDGIIIGYAISLIGFSYVFIKNIGRTKLSISQLKSKFNFITHSYSHALSLSIANFADKIIIAPLFGFVVLGVYQLSFQFLQFAAIIPLSLYLYLLPQIASGNNNKFIPKIGIIISICIAFTFFFTTPLIIKEFYPQYLESIPIAQIMSFGIIPMTINAIINSKFLGTEKSKPIFFGSIIYISSLFLSINYLGSFFGTFGLGISIVLSFTLQSIFLLFSYRFYTKHFQS